MEKNFPLEAKNETFVAGSQIHQNRPKSSFRG
jgi:hypothetical protein